jgi:carbamoyltransferase
MKVCGIKITHDAAVCVIEDGVLLFSVELEKLENRARYSKMRMLDDVPKILAKFGIDMEQIDAFVVDGWKQSSTSIEGKRLELASYTEFDDPQPMLKASVGLAPVIGHYMSYKHMATHIIAAYATSPFAENESPAYVLTWDGGQNLRLHLVDPKNYKDPIHFQGSLTELSGAIYTVMGLFFGPYKNPLVYGHKAEEWGDLWARTAQYEIPGKLMSYIALGQVRVELVRVFQMCYCSAVMRRSGNPLGYDESRTIDFNFMREVFAAVNANYPDEDVLASMHLFLESQLVMGARLSIPDSANVIFTGGSALNIKWNSALRQYFPSLWVPPFPNDCGNAIGAAMAMFATRGLWKMEWDAYLGPEIEEGNLELGWTKSECSIRQLAQKIHDGACVVVLHGRSELGPRALGHRSIICSATDPAAKDMLNAMKRRENFRPVAPICLEEFAPSVFSPGSPDPYMLFEHDVIPAWQNRIPAIVHLDGSARLQTVGRNDSPFVYHLLREYFDISGIPVLCNTSANENGSGFFPDVASAMRWGKCRFIWSGGFLYEKE